MDNQASLLIEVPPMTEIKFRTPFDLDAFIAVMRVVFPGVGWYPRYQEWTLRMPESEYGVNRLILDEIFELYYPDNFPKVTVTTELPRVVEIKPTVKKVAPAPVRYQKPAGETYGGIDT